MDLFGIAYESSGVLEYQPTADPNVLDVIIVSEGWGSSGYYDGDVLHRDGATAFPKGTRSFIDHAEGPVESAKGLVGVLEEAARPDVVDGKKVLRAPIRFFKTGQYNADYISERANAKGIELSLRAPVKYAQGTREGRYGKVVTALQPAFSVDVVARGGAGGKFSGTIQESKPIGNDETDPKEGDEVPLTAEELTQIGTVFAEAMKPSLDAINTSLTGLATAQENKVVTGTALTTRGIASKIGAAKISDAAKDRVYIALEAEGVVATEAFVDTLIGAEATIAEEAKKALLAEKDEHGNALFSESAGAGGDNGGGAPAGAYKPGMVSAWARPEVKK